MALRDKILFRAQLAFDLLLRRVRIVTGALAASSFFYILILPYLASDTYIDEPALLPGVAAPTIRYGLIIFGECGNILDRSNSPI